MPQVLKAEVRERIRAAALMLFAQCGFAGTTMHDIAREAGMAVANTYRYYGSKEELFDAAVPGDIVARFEQLLERSVQAHAHLAGLPRPRDEAAAGELLEFWIEHRLVVIILLDRAQGSMHAGFAQRFVDRLVALSIAEIRMGYPGIVVHREARLVLCQIFENTRRMIAVLLESCPDPPAIRRAVAEFRNYQVAGLAAFARGLAAESSSGA
jgi:AcrR family transcriptional regulator